jgi:hypothetical protein
MAKEEAGAADPAGSGVPTCTQIGLCVPGPDNRLHSSPTSVTSFTDMSPEPTVKGLNSYGSDDTAFPLVCASSLLSLSTEQVAGPSSVHGGLQGSLNSCRLSDLRSPNVRT